MKQLQLITEDSTQVGKAKALKGKKLYIDGIFSTAEVLNKNNRKYSNELLTREVDRFQKQIKEQTAWGCLGHPQTIHSDPQTISHIVRKLEMKENHAYGRAEVLNTPSGKILETLVNSGTYAISSRGTGTVNNETKYVNEDFRLHSYDCVSEQSNPDSFISGIYEGRTFSLCEQNASFDNMLEYVEDPNNQLGNNQLGFDYHFVNVDTGQKDFTTCHCESCGETQHVPSPLTCESAICLKCDADKSQFVKMIQMWQNKIKERNRQ